MLPVRVRDVSFARDGEMLRRMHRLLLAVVAVVVCVAVTGPFRGFVAVRTSIATMRESTAPRSCSTGDDDASPRHADLARDERVDLEAIESEVDGEEDDALNDLADETTFALTCAPLRRVVRSDHVELASDTSRRHHRTISARGPPT
jgi:hypothetical protein